MSNVARLPVPVTYRVRVPAAIDGNVVFSKLARGLASQGLCFSNQRDGSLLIHEIPAALRFNQGEHDEHASQD